MLQELARYYTNADQKRLLLKNLKPDPNLYGLILIYKNDISKDFTQTANYIYENASSLTKAVLNTGLPTARMLNITKNEVSACFKTIQTMANEMS